MSFNSSHPVIVFVHKGYSGYLPHTMACAKISNPESRFILIGDEQTTAVARDQGWEHVSIGDLDGPDLQRFQSKYRLIATKNHPDFNLPYDMTKFCFERYFLAWRMAEAQAIPSFWMFDSDDVIAEPLAPFAAKLFNRGANCTRMANNTALRGLMDTPTIGQFCNFTTDLFANEQFVQGQLAHYAGLNQMAAFTDMSAGSMFPVSSPACVDLSNAFDGWHFDNCILQSHGFEMTRLGYFTTQMMKRLKFDGRHFYALYGSAAPVKFATINGSGLSPKTFRWLQHCLASRAQNIQYTGEISSSRPSLAREIAYQVKRRAKQLKPPTIAS